MQGVCIYIMDTKDENIDDFPMVEELDARTQAENIKLIIAEWLDQKHIRMKTRFNKRSARAVTTLQGLADKYNIKTLDDYLLQYRINMLSVDRESSKELTDILKARMPDLEQSQLEKLSQFLE